MAARHRQLPTRPGGCLKCLSFRIEAASDETAAGGCFLFEVSELPRIEAASDETPAGCLSGACSCSTTYGAVQDSARKSVRTEFLLDTHGHADRVAFGLRPAPQPLKRVVVTPPPAHPSS